eukprot:gene1584-3061_t
MADLEDRILRSNVPGRWSSLTGEEDDIRHDDDNGNDVSDEDENVPPVSEEQDMLEHARSLVEQDVPEPVRRSILADRARKHNTGVKGVLADYSAHVKMEQAHANAEATFRQDLLTRIAEGSKRTEVMPPQPPVANEEADDEDEEDSLFFVEFRKKRLLELQASSAMPQFGSCREVDATDFLDQVDKEDNRVIVMVHLYETSVQSCVRLNRHMEELAVRRPDWKLLRMNASSNSIEIDRIAMPILTIYRGGRVVNTLMALDQQLGPLFTVDDVEWLLETEGLGLDSVVRTGYDGLNWIT